MKNKKATKTDRRTRLKPACMATLRSGGPIMMIHKIKGKSATCRWFVGSVLKSEEFLITSLEPSDGSPRSIKISFVKSDGNGRPKGAS
jgi:uncharacterized protein YodC (DUF2158 family)